MKRNLIALPAVLAFVLAACGQEREAGQDTGATPGAESGAVPADTGVAGSIEDTTAAPSVDVGTDASAPSADTGSASSDTAAPSGDTAVSAGDSADQTQSGVTDSSGQSELGSDVTQTTPDQGEAVTSKGDTVGTSGAGATSDTAQQ